MIVIVIILTVLFAVGGLAIIVCLLSLLHGTLSFSTRAPQDDKIHGFEVVMKSPSPGAGVAPEPTFTGVPTGKHRRTGHVAGRFKVDADG